MVPNSRLNLWERNFFKTKENNQEDLRPQYSSIMPVSNNSPRTAVFMKLVITDGAMHLVPTTEHDTMFLLHYACGSHRSESISISVACPADQMIANPYDRQHVSKDSTSTLSLQPKHIYLTPSDTYRVQLGRKSIDGPNRKFSRNTRTEEDALWICELALLIINKPNSFEEIVRNGNFVFIRARGLVSSPKDMMIKLVEKSQYFKRLKVLREYEVSDALHVLGTLIPPLMIAAIIRKIESDLSAKDTQIHSGTSRRKRRRLTKAIASSASCA